MRKSASTNSEVIGQITIGAWLSGIALDYTIRPNFRLGRAWPSHPRLERSGQRCGCADQVRARRPKSFPANRIRVSLARKFPRIALGFCGDDELAYPQDLLTASTGLDHTEPAAIFADHRARFAISSTPAKAGARSATAAALGFRTLRSVRPTGSHTGRPTAGCRIRLN